ncbi:MHYT domain-containing protein [Psychrosphaera sp. 1_MG-2023]|uniref:MHYT domain-containing protein n=1 Tax=Psychrosphaera sp. 1_MG-2023 TaxID=3062643 RepID=UPI0026E1A4E8|nr:MHYT domain-containing protein [Psychrosphaera sp. 1_MG-2023]MDO6719917.1 MHYT domain-containing protein [Psychrosphaera sp. 1_MG-2023]
MKNTIAELFQYDSYNLFVSSLYNPWLVTLSVAIAIFASFMGFQVASQAAYKSPIRKHISLCVGSIALGGGVWSMHFLGMLALELCTNVTYNVQLTAISVLPSIIASWIALNIITRDQIKFTQLILGGVLVGAGIGTMHYVGMAAMEMAPLLRYNLVMFGVSILVAVSLAILSLWISFGLKTQKVAWINNNVKILISSVVMGGAISGMHYTGMAAARFAMPPGIELSKQTNDISIFLAMVITTITLTIIFLVLGANLIFRYRDKSKAAINNERRLIATMNTAIDGIITIDSVGTVISINTAVTHLLGWQPEEVIGQNVKMLVPSPHQAQHDQYIENYLKTREAKIIGSGREVEALTKNGEKIPVRLGIGHVELNDENMFVAFISDLRERQKMENQLRESESQLRSLVTNIPGIAYRCLDLPGWPNVFINDEIENIVGYPAKDFLLPNPKRSLGDFVHPEDIGNITATDLRSPKGYKLEFRLIDRENNTKWMLGYGRAIKIDGSDEYYLDGFIMDITDRKKMESELIAEKENAEKAAATRAAFLANMSHEIRTPMNAIIGFSDILLDEELSNNQRKQLNTINQSAKSLLHILNDVLDSAKLEKGKFQLEYRDFSLVEEVDTVVSTLWLQAQNKGLDIKLNIDKATQRCYNGVPDRIRQVLTNIIGNAIKFTEAGHVTIDINEKSEGIVTFIISDSGIGMTSTQLATIFDAFAQADESMSRRFGGTGLGTTISKQLVELMGGEITARSELNIGSEFEFSIPLTPIAPIQKATTAVSFNELPPLNILIVDDIEQNLDLLSLILKRNNHKITVARNGVEALSKMQSDKFDVVLMDIQMPIMDGLTAASERRQFEQQNDLPRLPIIALTASVLPQDKQSASKAGMDGFANKPIDMHQLMGEIANALSLQSVASEETKIAPAEDLRIDIEKGIALWGSKTVLFSEISRFLGQSNDEIEALKVLMKQQDWLSVEETAHKNKGVTGNLALIKLMILFAELERVSRQRLEKECLAVVTNIEVEIDLLGMCANKMRATSTELEETQDLANSDADDTVANEELYNTLLQLEKHVKNNEFDDPLLDSLLSIKSVHSKKINDIVAACNDFEFELALSRIVALVSLLKPET